MTGTARDHMTADAVTFAPETDIHRAIRTLLERRISGAPVVDRHGNLVGILTTRDCLKIAFGASYHQEPGGIVSELMSTDVETVEAGTDIVEVAQRFLGSRFHRFPVMDGGRLVGVISRHDALHALATLW